MNITEIVSVSPINPAHGRHEVHARTTEGIDVTFTISPGALGCLTGYFDSFDLTDSLYAEHVKQQQADTTKATKKKGS